ncbi:MAG: ABC transporter ATP-binding protein [Tepidanaerobacter acetatoxydans]|uniref:ABC transporter ATP-binding protein n=1 Tax=Tepidanaerobacter TaxID=499228 RepID=UPI000A79C6FD|nr:MULTISPECIES: ABC transporter ATP-binding protein [Tepidanaerobacter]NLU10827.1 ABC transporter ATP-binding protein [Tepidanaerobacter acetatoxydans]
MSFSVRFDEVSKNFGEFRAIQNASFTVEKGEFFTLLGPSGCGKTTLLRMVAGFNPIDSGKISFDDKIINNIPAHKRNIGMVFQNYAIFPHMTVFENVAYGLKARGVSRSEIDERVMEALTMVKMEGLKDRSPQQLSGGQQQRIALARAIVIRPGALLMDEPLSNLDAKLRVEMRTTIKKLQQSLGITTIYVTHDQEEALAISDRIGVMKDGFIQQIDSPEVIYKHPENAFVANFIGTSNFIESKIIQIGSQTYLDVVNVQIPISLKENYEGEAKISLRPEHVYLTEEKDNTIKGEIQLATFLGDFTKYEILLENGQTIEANEYTKDVSSFRKPGDEVRIKIHTDKINLFDSKGEVALL